MDQETTARTKPGNTLARARDRAGPGLAVPSFVQTGARTPGRSRGPQLPSAPLFVGWLRRSGLRFFLLPVVTTGATAGTVLQQDRDHLAAPAAAEGWDPHARRRRVLRSPTRRFDGGPRVA